MPDFKLVGVQQLVLAHSSQHLSDGRFWRHSQHCQLVFRQPNLEEEAAKPLLKILTFNRLNIWAHYFFHRSYICHPILLIFNPNLHQQMSLDVTNIHGDYWADFCQCQIIWCHFLKASFQKAILKSKETFFNWVWKMTPKLVLILFKGTWILWDYCICQSKHRKKQMS